MKRVLIAVGVVILCAAGVAALWAWRSTRPQKVVRGSPTVEFHPTEKPAAEKRPVVRKRKRSEKVILKEPWPTYGYDAARTHLAAYPARPPFRQLWFLRARHLLEFPPVVAYGNVYLSQQRGRFFAVDARTGTVRWQKNFRRCSASSPAVGKGVVYATYMHTFPCGTGNPDNNGFLIAMNARTGRELWSFRPGAIESSPLLVDGILYFGSWDHKLYALDARTHRIRWTFEADDQLNSSPAYAGGTVFVASDGGSVYAVDARTGKLRWQAQSHARFGRREYFYATPTVAYGRVYIGNTDGTVFAFGAGTGDLLWAQRAGTYVYAAAAVWRKTVYVGSYDGTMYAFDAGTGDVRWRYSAPSAIHGAPTVLDGLLYFSTCGTCGSHGSRYAKQGARGTYALDARTGKLVWSFHDGQYSPVVADEDRVYLTGRTRLYGLAPVRKAETRRLRPEPSRARKSPASRRRRAPARGRSAR